MPKDVTIVRDGQGEPELEQVGIIKTISNLDLTGEDTMRVLDIIIGMYLGLGAFDTEIFAGIIERLYSIRLSFVERYQRGRTIRRHSHTYLPHSTHSLSHPEQFLNANPQKWPLSLAPTSPNLTRSSTQTTRM